MNLKPNPFIVICVVATALLTVWVKHTAQISNNAPNKAEFQLLEIFNKSSTKNQNEADTTSSHNNDSEIIDPINHLGDLEHNAKILWERVPDKAIYKPIAKQLANQARHEALGGKLQLAREYMIQAIKGGDGRSENYMLLAEWVLLTKDNPWTPALAWQAYTAFDRTDELRQRAARFLAKYYEDKDKAIAIEAYEILQSLLPSDKNIVQKLALLRGEKMEVLKMRIEGDSDIPQACFMFSQKLASKNWDDYAVVEPPVKLSARSTGKDLCLEGLEHAIRYKITLRQGIADERGIVMDKDYTEAVSIPSRPARVSFRGKRYVLPRFNNSGVPLYSVNAQNISVQILRVNDRNLINQLQRNSLDDDIHSYRLNMIKHQTGEEIWSGILPAENAPNHEIVTPIQVQKILPKIEPGLYLLTASPTNKTKTTQKDISEEDSDEPGMATQWLVISDIGLASYNAQTEFTVSARSFADAKPLSGIRLALIAQNNKELAEGITDAQGLAHFNAELLRGKGGNSPVMLMAYGKNGDFAFMQLNQSAIDLSDRGVSGRDAAKPLDAFLYAERDIYRPGENVHIMTLLRDQNGLALDMPPALMVRVSRPDNVTFSEHVMAVKDFIMGGYLNVIALPENARTGIWKAGIYADPKGSPLASLNFQVEEFVPAKLEVKLNTQQKFLDGDNPFIVTAQADYLYGAPASDLATQAEMILQPNPAPFQQWQEYHFGAIDPVFSKKRYDINIDKTDSAGKVEASVKLDPGLTPDIPVEALVRVSVFEPGGRPASRTAIIPVHKFAQSIGIKPLFEDKRVDRKHQARFSIVLTDANGRALPGKIQYRLVEEHIRYQWYDNYRNWQYRSIKYDEEIKSGVVNTTADMQADLQLPVLNYGTYRVEFSTPDDPKTLTASYRFSSGWTDTDSNNSEARPDMLRLSSTKAIYAPGETAQIFLRPPFAGEATITVARENIIKQFHMTLPAEGKEIPIPVDESWSPGAYVIAQIYRPGDRAQISPARAIGVLWLATDTTKKQMMVEFNLPETIKPRQKLTVPFNVKNARGETYVAIAAVDEGVLQLTDYKSPNAIEYFFGKRRLGIELNDSYGRLIDTTIAGGKPRSGGDSPSEDQQRLPVCWIKPVSLFSGPIHLDNSGHGEIQMEIPDFNGRLRFMAVAWNKNQIGNGEQSLTIRDDMVVDTSLPRFMASGDKAQITVLLNNIAGAKGLYKVALSADEPLQTASKPQQFELDVKQSKILSFTLQALTNQTGTGQVRLRVTSPDGTERLSEWKMAVRAPSAPMTKRYFEKLAKGKNLTLDKKLLEGFIPTDAQAEITLTTGPNLDIAGVLRDLDRYPYGCLEQLTSRAMPLLYASEFKDFKDNSLETLPDRMQSAIAHIIDKQRHDGSFSLWNDDGYVQPWLSMFAADFLWRAREAGYTVPNFALNNALAWIKEYSGNSSSMIDARAYGYFVLARAGEAELSDLRYFNDNFAEQIASPLALSQLAAGLVILGDKERSATAFERGANTYSLKNAVYSWENYGSPIRDLAGMASMAYAYDLASPEKMYALGEELSASIASNSYLSTQEMSWIILAGKELLLKKTPLQASLGGVEKSGLNALHFPLEPGAISGKTLLENKSASDLMAVISIAGHSDKPLAAENKGFVLNRSFYTLDGNAADLGKIKQNTRLAVVLKGKIENNNGRTEALLVDMLPAGFEIENSRFGRSASADELSWLPKQTSSVHSEIRDDRWVAAIRFASDRSYYDEDNSASDSEFAFAYLVRAVSPGEYTVPAAQIENMYRPEIFARDETRKLVITPP